MTDSSRLQKPIAVVGVSALFPGSSDAGGFWRDILAGRDLITDVPPSHWLIEDYYDPDPTAPDKTYAKRGAFLSPVDFDPMQFGVPPSIVPATDTAQLLALIVAQQVLEDAAQGQFAKMDRERISVILGVTSAQELLGSMVSRLQRPVWTKALRESGIAEPEVEAICERIAKNYVPWQESSFPGLLGNVVAGRIANRFDLRGTNTVTDAACASALSALAMAVHELALGQSDLAITGGVDTLNDIFMYMCFSKTPALSPTGDCRPFSDGADGTMLGEGMGMLALKRLEDAERDGDRVYAVIRSVGSASDGRSKSVYAPLPEGQARALRRAYEGAGYGPETVELVEAHGTGTKAGDLAEFEGLRMTFDESGRKERQWCALGSVKSQIGHTKAAAGAAGLFKAVMALHHKTLPPTIKVEQPNPKLEVSASPFYLNTQTRPWIRDDAHPRRASVSSFGFGGSNFHVALEEYIPQGRGQLAWRLRSTPSELVLLAADTKAALAARCRGLIAEAGDLAKVARSTQLAFSAAQPVRVAIVATNAEDLAQKLEQAAASLGSASDDAFASPTGIYWSLAKQDGELAYLFPGQGSQYVGMGADLALAFDQARGVWDGAASTRFGGAAVHDVVFPRPVFSDADREAQARTLTATEWAQPALGLTSLSMVEVLRALGLSPACVAGHSFGEVTALCVAGAIGSDDLVRVARRRGELMRDASAMPGAMTAVSCRMEQLTELLARAGTDVCIANHNAPTQVVLSGSVAGIEQIERALEAAGLSAKRLPVATAFHSSLVAPSSAPLHQYLEGVAFKAPAIDVYGNTEAAPYPRDAAAMRGLLAAQLAKSVRFVDQIEAMYARGVRTFVEVGAGSVLSELVSRILADRPHQAISLDRKGRHGVTNLQHALGRLSVAGFALDFAPLWAPYAPASETPKPKPKMALSLNGSNYGKPYPPPGGAASLPKPNPARAPLALPAPAAARAAVPLAAPAVPAPVNAPATHAAKPAAAVARAVAHASAASPAHTNGQNGKAAPPSASHVAVSTTPTAHTPVASQNAMTTTSSEVHLAWVHAFQEAQRQTAEAHAALQRSMADSHVAFLRTAEASFTGLTAILTGSASAPVQALQPLAAPGPLYASAPPVAYSAPIAPAFVPAAALAAQVTTLPVAAAPVARAQVVAAQLQTVIAPVAAVPHAAPAQAAGINLEQLMLEVVAEKTGYPAEMLGMQMDLEADLGVDSIKRVEILALMRERAPGLGEVKPAELANLRTLGQIVDYMRAQGGVNEAASVPKTGPATTSSPAASGIDLERLMLEVVAEKTGYPAEMLGMQMDLEADLGVDSIKRVEILALMRERAPGLGEVKPAELANLRTLGQIVDYMRAQGGVAEAPHAAGAGVARATPKASGVNLEQLMLEVVAEKTGYPAEMLGLTMDLEADLGVDSIKRVEILALMRERAPGLGEVKPAELASLRTLGQIVDYMRAQGGVSESTPSTNGSAQASAASDSVAIDLEQLMLEVVAEKTGYPAEMLGLNMDLEADLGVDSIKRVEILALMRERAPGLGEVKPAELASLRTLGQIVEYMRAQSPAQATLTAAATDVVTASTSSGQALSRFVVREVAALPIGMGLSGITAGGRVVVTDDGVGIARALVHKLAERGVKAELVNEVPVDADVVLFLGGLAHVGSVDEAVAINREAFTAAKAVAARFGQQGGTFVCVQDTGGDFGLSGSDDTRAWLGGLAALVRTAALEWPKAALKTIDCARAGRSADAIAEAIVGELFAGGATLEVGLRADGTRTTLRSVLATVAPATGSRINAQSVIVASGGARGVTAATLIALAKAHQPRVVLLGRTALSDEPASCRGVQDEPGLKRALMQDAQREGRKIAPAEIGATVARVLANREVHATLDALTRAGSNAQYLAVDVQNPVTLSAALADVRRSFGPITGIVHGAGVLADKRIEDKTQEQFDRVFDTKVAGLRALLAATKDDPIDLLALFSSIAARTGNAGQSDYAMANEVLNLVANAERARRGASCVVSSIGWGPWEGGMVTPTLAEHFKQRGVHMIPIDAGARAFVDEIAGNSVDTQVVIGSQPGDGALGAAANPSITLEVRVDHRSHPELRDHTVAGTPVLPVVMALEWFARAAQACRPDLSLCAIESLKVLRGIRLDHYERGGDRFVLRCHQLSSGESTVLSLELRGRGDALHYTANAELRAQPMRPPVSAELPHLDHKGPAKIYDGHMLFHGKAFQVIRAIDGVSREGIAGTLTGTRDRGWASPGLLTDPAALDGALQLAVLWTSHVLGGASLPMAIGSFHLYATGAVEGPVRCIVRAKQAHDSRAVCDLMLVRDDGLVLAELRGIETVLRPEHANANATARA